MIGHCHCLIGEKVEEKRKVNLATALESIGLRIYQWKTECLSLSIIKLFFFIYIYFLDFWCFYLSLVVGFMITLCLDGDEADEKNES